MQSVYHIGGFGEFGEKVIRTRKLPNGKNAQYRVNAHQVNAPLLTFLSKYLYFYRRVNVTRAQQ